jgi:uncharacterized membrane protein YdjX (TVP38/TMEM64 family)
LILPTVEAVQRLGKAGPAYFIVLYILAVVALIPGAWLTVAGGAVFGVAPSVVYSLIGGTVGSTAAFLLGRYTARDSIARRLASMPRLRAVERAVSVEGRRVVLLLRLSPIAPFNFLNYVLGLTTISVSDFVIASVGMIPSTLIYAYSGALLREAALAAGQAHAPRSTSYYAMLVMGLVATLAVTLVVTRTARRALHEV